MLLDSETILNRIQPLEQVDDRVQVVGLNGELWTTYHQFGGRIILGALSGKVLRHNGCEEEYAKNEGELLLTMMSD